MAEKDGKKISAAFDCVNTISSDWNQVVFEDLKRDPSKEVDPESIYHGVDLIFAKDPLCLQDVSSLILTA